jgi:hypothetical protein
MVHLVRHRAVVLGHVAGVLAVWGWVTLPGLLSVDFYHLSLARHADRAEAINISDHAEEYAGAAILGFPVLLGFLGLVLLTVALWRSGSAPAWVPAVVVAGLAVTLVAPAGALSWAVGFGAISAALGYVGLQILRMSDEAWVRGVPPKVAPPAAATPQTR